MKYHPHKRWELVLRVAIARGDIETVQLVLGALRELDRSRERSGDRSARRAA